MAHNIFHTGAEWFEDTIIDPVKEKAEEIVKDYKINQIKKEFKKIPSAIADGFVTHDKLTPELIEQGWKEGLDGQPYNANLVYTADDWARDQANAGRDAAVANAVAGGGTTGGGTTTSGSVLKAQDLRQRTPSGTMYEPDLSEYESSSLFDYAGPGGLDEYTYGQGLPTEGAGYDIWGTPTDVPNPYYWGQFGEGYVEPEETGIADGAISLPPIDLPEGVSPTNNNPNVGTNTTNITTTSSGDKDLNYFETLAAMGINPEDAPSTTFPGPNDKLIEEAIMNQNAVKETLPSGIIGGEEQVFGGSYNMLPNDDGIFDYTGLNRNIANDEQVYPSLYDMQASDDGAYDYTGLNRNIANDEQVYDANYNMQASDDGSFNYGSNNQANFETANSIFNPPPNKNIIRNPYEETQPYRGIYIDPRTVPEINAVQSDKMHLPSFPADYDTGSNINLVTTTDEPYIPSIPIVQGDNEDFDKPIIQNDLVENTNYNKIELPKVSSDLDSQYATIWFDMPEYDENYNYKTGKMAEGPAGSPHYGAIPAPVEETVPYSNERTHYEMQDLWGDRYDWGIMDYIDHYNPLKDDSVAPLEGPAGSTVPSYSGHIDTSESQLGKINASMSGTSPGWGDSRIWENPPEPTAEVALPNDNLINLVHSQTPRIDAQEASYMGQEDPSLNILMHKMASGMDGLIDYAPGTSGAIDQIVANTLLQQQAVQPVAEHPGITAKKNLAAKHSAAQTQAKAVAQKKVYQKQYEQLKKAGAPVRRSGNRYGFGF